MRTNGFIFKLAQFIIFLYILLVELTSRTIVKSTLPLKRLKDMEPKALISFWHNRIFHFCWMFRGIGGAIPISTHRDGLLIAGVAKMFGHKVISGSSNRSAVSVLAGIINSLEKGKSVAVTPDGPRGPKYSVQNGILFAAWKTGVPIIPAAWYASGVKILKSWDGFVFPFPFNTFYVVLGEPVFVKSRKDISRMKDELKERMDLVTREVEDHFKKN